MSETEIVSFVLRFTGRRDALESPLRVSCGLIRHVQRGEEIRFTHIKDMLEFLSRYMDLSQMEKETLSIGG